MRNKLAIIYIVVFILMVCLYKIFYFYCMDKCISELKNDVITLADMNNKKFIELIKNEEIGLNAITENKIFKKFINTNNSNIENMEELFLTILKQNKNIYQLRYIDEFGNEVIRVQKKDGKSEIVEKSNLENKSYKNYYSESINLMNKNYYISNLDLDIDFSFKPALRISKPIKNYNGEIHFIIMSIDMNEYLDNFLVSEKFNMYLLDKDNYLIVSNTKDKQWERYIKKEKFDKKILLKDSFVKKLDLDSEDGLTLVLNTKEEFLNSEIDKVMRYILIILFIIHHIIILILFFRIHQKELEEKIKEAINENTINEKILFKQSKLASMGEMIENIAHQWRQPLSAISTLASGLNMMMKIENVGKERVEQMLLEVVNQTKQLSKTIDVFRNFLKHDKCYIIDSIEGRIQLALQISEMVIKENNIKLVNKINYNNNNKIKVVPGELSQVLINLFNNAKDAFKERNIINPTIELDLNVDNNKIYLTVEDNAGGINEHILPRVFEPYFTTKHQSQGTGIGLYMSYRIIKESFKGDLLVKNTDKGAKFTVEIPLIFDLQL